MLGQTLTAVKQIFKNCDLLSYCFLMYPDSNYEPEETWDIALHFEHIVSAKNWNHQQVPSRIDWPADMTSKFRGLNAQKSIWQYAGVLEFWQIDPFYTKY